MSSLSRFDVRLQKIKDAFQRQQLHHLVSKRFQQKKHEKRIEKRRFHRKKADNILKEAFANWNYPYLILNNSQNCPENIRIQGMFPDEHMYIYE